MPDIRVAQSDFGGVLGGAGMSDLKPCPFCGSTNVGLRKGMFWNGAVHCYDCSADVVFEAVELIAKGDYDWQTAVTDGWNRRAYEAD